MNGERRTVILAEISSEISYGYTTSAKAERIGPRFLRITDIRGGSVTWDTVPFCKIPDSQIPKYLLEKGDIVVARTGNSTGENYLFKGDEDTIFASYLVRFRISSSIADPRYVWYTMRSPAWWNFIQGVKTGSAQAGVNAKILSMFRLPLPPLPEQRAIAHILGTLDDKIELNRRMNETLEAVVQALFKSWFVDFDPVVVNAIKAGTPIPDKFAEHAAYYRENPDALGLPEHILRLFPNRFQESELGPIPEGWRVEEIGDVIELGYGKSLPKKQRNSGPYPVYGSGGIVGFHNKFFVTGPGIIVGRKGTVGSVYWEEHDFFPIDTVFYVKVRKAVPLYWVFLMLHRMDIKRMGADSAVPGVNRNAVYAHKWVIPKHFLFDTFQEFLSTILKKIQENGEEINNLCALRDTLLPKLISGELRMPKIERFLEERGQ